uniref:RRP15-like protein n=1 Tax=Sphenodon punctatus TaxID=8508 RepID=A0A8D0L7M3_SPHPU
VEPLEKEFDASSLSPGSEWSSGLPDDSFSSEGEVLEGDDEEEAAACDNTDENAAKCEAGPSAGWAEAMAKVLNKKIPQSKPTILVKNKKLDKVRKKEKQERMEKRKQLDKKREWEMMCRVKPDVAKDRETERNLQRIATRGVVQLFNAVRKHQKNIDEKVKDAGKSDRKRAKLMSTFSKKDFINADVKSEEGPEWRILQDDFMMGASMKDWDKESDKESNDGPIGLDSGSDSDR